MNEKLAKAYCEDYIHLNIPQNEDCLCHISIRHINPITHEEYDLLKEVLL